MSRSAQRLILCGLYLCCALFTALPGEAFAQTVGTPLPLGPEVVEIEGYGFPPRIAGLARSTKTDFGSPDLGFSVRYGTSRDTWADIYVYDDPRVLSAGSLSLATREVDEAIEGVKALVDQGLYQRAAVRSRSTSGPFAAAHLTIVQGGRERRVLRIRHHAQQTVHQGPSDRPSRQRCACPCAPLRGRIRPHPECSVRPTWAAGFAGSPLKQISQGPLTPAPRPGKTRPMIARHIHSAMFYTPSS